MRKNRNLFITLLLCLMLTFGIFGCSSNESTEKAETTEATETTEQSETVEDTSDSKEEGLWADASYTEDTELGEGNTTVKVEVSAEDKSITFTVHTDETVLGDALLAHSLIAGEESEYGLYVKDVNGMTADYDTDKAYWAFYKDGEYMNTGVDGTTIADGEHYELVYTQE
ncbi:MAG: DUF4430 domain-containing protein [Lachnospiraceae bacterium]